MSLQAHVWIDSVFLTGDWLCYTKQITFIPYEVISNWHRRLGLRLLSPDICARRNLSHDVVHCYNQILSRNELRWCCSAVSTFRSRYIPKLHVGMTEILRVNCALSTMYVLHNYGLVVVQFCKRKVFVMRRAVMRLAIMSHSAQHI